jgi:hypothetical protein
MVYTKQYSQSGTYADTDGIKGIWTLPVKDSLVETYSNYPSVVTQGYKITNLTATQMTLTYYSNSTNVTATYTAIY